MLKQALRDVHGIRNLPIGLQENIHMTRVQVAVWLSGDQTTQYPVQCAGFQGAHFDGLPLQVGHASGWAGGSGDRGTVISSSVLKIDRKKESGEHVLCVCASCLQRNGDYVVFAQGIGR